MTDEHQIEDPFKEYLRETEPNIQEKLNAWRTAIGLQAVDGLTTSDYLIETAKRNIEGELSIYEVQELLHKYYEEHTNHDPDDRTEEADIVSSRITQLLNENAFSLTTQEYLSIHRKLFNNLYLFAGQVRDYNISKKEWILDGTSVVYGTATEIIPTIEYELTREKQFKYKGLTPNQLIKHYAQFVASLWQIHAFGEGNTRTTAVFLIKYLRTQKFSVSNDMFEKHAWYFRNALVRANYSDPIQGIDETTEYLELFLRNLLLGEHNSLSNRIMHISNALEHTKKPDIKPAKADIESKKSDIQPAKADIQPNFENLSEQFGSVSTRQIEKLFEHFGTDVVFGRTNVMQVLDIKTSRASALLKALIDNNIIEAVSGHGKGKYKFIS